MRPFSLVDDFEASASSAVSPEAYLHVAPMKLHGDGWCTVIVQGGIEYGIWQV